MELESHLLKIQSVFKKLKVFANDIDVSDLMRIYVCLQEHATFHSSSSPRKKDVFRDKAIKLFYVSKDILPSFHRFLFNRKKIFIFSSSREFFSFNKQGRTDKLFIELMNLHRSSFFYFFQRSNYSNHLVSPSSSTYNFYFLSLLIKPFVKIKIKTNYDLTDLTQISNHFINSNRIIYKFIYYSYIFNIYFKIKRPKIIFISNYYSICHAALIYSCKKLNIPTVEFQHGVINSIHSAYNYKLVNKNLRPDKLFYYLLSPNLDKEKFYIDIENCFNIGHPYLDYLESLEVEEKTESNLLNRKLKVIILVSLETVRQEILIPFIIKAAIKMPDYKFILLPRHPYTDFKEYYIPYNVSFEFNKNFYQLLRECSIHVAISSTCTLEAYAMGIPCISLNSNSFKHNYYSEFNMDNNFVYVETLEEFINAINQYRANITRKHLRKRKFIISGHRDQLYKGLNTIYKEKRINILFE